MLDVALTGNVAAGKSTVLRHFQEWGATVIDADAIVRSLQVPGSPVFAAIVEHFGTAVVQPDGALDRAALRARILGDPTERQALEALVHPAVQAERARQAEGARHAGARVLVSDIPLLYETLDPASFDTVVFVDAPETVRRARLIDDRGLTPVEAERLMAIQGAPDAKRAASPFIIENAGTRDDLRARTREVWQALETLAQVP